jgi:putative membrane protein
LKNRKFNFNIGEFTWLVLLLAISFYFYRLVHLGYISMFINPNMSKYVVFASGVLLMLGLFQIPKIINTSESKPKFGYLIFIIPIIIGILVKPIGLTQQITEAKGVSIVQNSTQTSATTVKNSNTINQDTEIVFNDKNYFTFLNGIDDDPNKFKNFKITLTGFVYKDNTLKDGQFVISRILMICCAADTQVVGLLCDYNGQNLAKDTWVQITGVLDTINYTDSTKQNSLIPLIKVQSIKKVDPPKSKYIYLNLEFGR